MSDTRIHLDLQKNIYTQSTILSKFLKNTKKKYTLKLAFLDIDFTLSANTSLLPEIRSKLEEYGYATVFVTARTEEMAMSQKAYEKSVESGFMRPAPHLLKKNGSFTYIDPKEINPYLVDPDIIIGSTGTQILVKQQSGEYKKDILFEKKMTSFTPLSWRSMIVDLLFEIDPEQKKFTIAPIESSENYYKGDTNVFPPDFRVQILFSSIEAKRWFLKELHKRKDFHTFAKHNPSAKLRIIDDSYEKVDKISVYITPRLGNKGSAVEHVVEELFSAVQQHNKFFTKSDIEAILAGDSFPDLAMLLHGAFGTSSKALLVGGSEVGKVLTDMHNSTYIGEDLSAIKTRLSPLKKMGYYSYKIPAEVYGRQGVRELIIGDRAYPHTKGPETLLAFLASEHH